MAIALEYINFIVQRTTIDEKYPGGWAGCLEDYDEFVGGAVWFDEHLFRTGAMSPWDIQNIVEYWESLGFQARGSDSDGKNVWLDFCVVERAVGHPDPSCDWLMIEEGVGYLRGTRPGNISGPVEIDVGPQPDLPKRPWWCFW